MASVNVVVLKGRLATPQEVVEHAGGVRFVTFELTTEDADGLVDVVPVTWVQAKGSAPRFSVFWKPGEQLVVIGQIGRRFSRNKEVTIGRTEVVASHVDSWSEDRRLSQASIGVITGAIGKVQPLVDHQPPQAAARTRRST